MNMRGVSFVALGTALFGLFHHWFMCGRWFDLADIDDVTLIISRQEWGIVVHSHEPLIIACLGVGLVCLLVRLLHKRRLA